MLWPRTNVRETKVFDPVTTVWIVGLRRDILVTSET